MIILSLLSLNDQDISALRIKDTYSLHRIVYDLFDDIRNDQQKKESNSSGFLFVDKGCDNNKRKILILSDRYPCLPKYGKIESKIISESFLMYDIYDFEITLNPTKRDFSTGKIVPIRGSENIKEWFVNKAATSWGFTVLKEKLEIKNIDVKTFDKKGHHVTQESATLIGELSIIDRDKFFQSFKKGIGRGKSFGFGLLQIIPLLK